MKHRKTLQAALFILIAVFASQIEARGGWLDQGLNIIKSYDPKSTATPSPTTTEISTAFKEALRIGADNVVAKLGRLDGFNSDPAIHIPLPDELMAAKSLLGKIGMGSLADDLELKLNRALENATPKAKELFWQAITAMTFEDVKNIYNGPKDSATKYFQQKMTPALYKEMQPIVDQSLSQVGAVAAYDLMVGEYKNMPFVPDLKGNLSDHALNKGLEGLFYYIAKEEEAIRADPAKQTTALLKRVFGAK